MKAEKEAMEAQKDIDFVLRLDSKGKNIAEIADLTDISAETIKNILKQHKK